MISIYQVPEMALDHQLKCLGRAGGVSGHHWIPGHDSTDRGRPRVKAFRRHLRSGQHDPRRTEDWLDVLDMPSLLQ